MKQRLEGWLHRALRPFGFDLKRYNALADPNLRRQRILKRHRIEQVLDGGANRGQYAARLREDGYRGRLLSVEPGAAAFAALQRASLRDDKWQVVQAALGAAPGHATLNVTANSVSSSLLAAADAQAAVSGAHVVTTERVEVTTLDVLAARFLERSSPTLLKLDVQGSEGAALDGGAELLGRVEARRGRARARGAVYRSGVRCGARRPPRPRRLRARLRRPEHARSRERLPP
ncbi:MAG: FkbM family methyltransferase [Planctomycetota bacterium]